LRRPKKWRLKPGQSGFRHEDAEETEEMEVEETESRRRGQKSIRVERMKRPIPAECCWMRDDRGTESE
jgi:hypothetical protein